MILLTPGPTPVPEEIRQVMATKTIHHRTPEFEEIFKETRTLALKVFKTKEIIFLASSGTGAMEASVINFCKKKALVVNSGKFGERFGKIAKAFGKDVLELKYEWDTPASVEDVINAIKSDEQIDTLCIQICESAGGLRHPVELIAKEVKKINPNIMIIADGITAVLVEPIYTDNIDVLIAGSQKAFMLPPGLAMIGLNDKAIEKLEKEGGVGYYFNLKSELSKQQENTTAYTAATTLIIGLNAVLKQVFNYGLFATFIDTYSRANATKKALIAIGLEIYPKSPALSMTTVYTDKSNAIRKILKEKYEVNIAGGQDHVKGKIFRINHMGHIPLYESSWAVNAVELALDELNIRKFDGTANRVFFETIKG